MQIACKNTHHAKSYADNTRMHHILITKKPRGLWTFILASRHQTKLQGRNHLTNEWNSMESTMAILMSPEWP